MVSLEMKSGWERNILEEILEKPDQIGSDKIVMIDKPIDQKIENRFKKYFVETNRFDKAIQTFSLVRAILETVLPGYMRNEIIKHLLDFEWLAHSRLKVPKEGKKYPKLYRDHILHPAKVCAIGWWIMNQGSIDELNVEKIANNIKRKYKKRVAPDADWKKISRMAWIIASLGHDICYPKEFIGKLIKNDEKVEPNLWKRVLTRKEITKNCNLYNQKTKKRTWAKSELEKKVKINENAHAQLSAYQLAKSMLDNQAFGLGEDETISIEIAGEAIFNHHSKDWKKVSFNNSPISYLLALSDVCHEFGREIVIWRESETIKNAREAMHLTPICATRIIKKNKEITVEYEFNDQETIQILAEAGFNPYMYAESKVNSGEYKRLNPKKNGKFINGFTIWPKVITNKNEVDGLRIKV